jgi:hypothetical protein
LFLLQIARGSVQNPSPNNVLAINELSILSIEKGLSPAQNQSSVHGRTLQAAFASPLPVRNKILLTSSQERSNRRGLRAGYHISVGCIQVTNSESRQPFLIGLINGTFS